MKEIGMFLPLLALGACNVDNTVSGEPKQPGFDDGTLPGDTAETTETGLSDCLPLTLASAGETPISDACDVASPDPVTDPWRLRVKWSFTHADGQADATQAWATPVVGNLDDDNHDGVVDDQDVPDVIIDTGLTRTLLVAIDGATGLEKWQYANTAAYASAIIADIDVDGYPDVVTADGDHHTVALEGDGTVKWVADDPLPNVPAELPAVADLDEDGQPEVIHDQYVLDGRDGAIRFVLDTPNLEWDQVRGPAIGDVDLDGDQEIFLGGTLFDSTGEVLWQISSGAMWGWPVLIQADEDPEAEIGFTAERWSLWDTDGTLLNTATYGTYPQPGPPCVADFDGDGVSEVVSPTYGELVMLESDGTEAWSVPSDDVSGMAGCAAFDVNADGTFEVLYADETSFGIYDGRTGATRVADYAHLSRTIYDYPSVADVDHDGHTEILVAQSGNGVTDALVVYENDGDGWPPAGPSWGAHDFSQTTLTATDGVPQHPEPPWLTYGLFRGRAAEDDHSQPDLAVDITDVCLLGCEAGAAVGVEVRNEGATAVPAGATLTLYAEDAAGPRAVGMRVLDEVPGGTVLDGIEFDLVAADVGDYGFTAEVDSSAVTSQECSVTNDRSTWTEVLCP